MKRPAEEDAALASLTFIFNVQPCSLEIPCDWEIWAALTREKREAIEKEVLLNWFLLKETVATQEELPIDIFYGVMAPLTIALLTVISEQGIRVRLYESMLANMLRAFAMGHPRISFYYDKQRYTMYSDETQSYVLKVIVHSCMLPGQNYQADACKWFPCDQNDIIEACEKRIDILLSDVSCAMKYMVLYG